jgi:uncharacterized protein YyaL (SSP411 family)
MAEFTLKWNGQQAIKQAERAGEEGLHKAAEAVLEAAQERVPVDTGELRSSGRVQVLDDGEAAVVFTADHAITVHEDLEAFHPEGEAKFLERALAAQKKAALDAIAAELRRALR